MTKKIDIHLPIIKLFIDRRQIFRVQRIFAARKQSRQPENMVVLFDIFQKYGS